MIYALWKQTQDIAQIERVVQSMLPNEATHFTSPLNKPPSYHLTTCVYTFAKARKSSEGVWVSFGWIWILIGYLAIAMLFIFGLLDWHQLLNIWTEILSKGFISHSLKCEQTWNNSWQRAWEKDVFCQVRITGKVLGRTSAVSQWDDIQNAVKF